MQYPSLKKPVTGLWQHDFNSFPKTFNDLIPNDVNVVTESGITKRSDVEKMMSRGVFSFLVGEAFMKEPDPGRALELLFT